MNDNDLCQWLRANSSGTYRPSAEGADRIEALNIELAELKSQHKEAVDRIKDLLLGDDGQACKEAERYLDKQKKILTQAKGTDNASR